MKDKGKWKLKETGKDYLPKYRLSLIRAGAAGTNTYTLQFSEEELEDLRQLLLVTSSGSER